MILKKIFEKIKELIDKIKIGTTLFGGQKILRLGEGKRAKKKAKEEKFKLNKQRYLNEMYDYQYEKFKNEDFDNLIYISDEEEQILNNIMDNMDVYDQFEFMVDNIE